MTDDRNEANTAQADASDASAAADNSRSLTSANITCSGGLADWLVRQGASLALSSYQTGQLYLIGVRRDCKINFHQVGVGRAMGLWADPQRLVLATQNQVLRFENVLAPDQRMGEADRHYLPHVAHTTGNLNIHDIVVLDNGVIVFANTLYSCLATLHNVHAFKPVWAPPFISKLAAEDRCHLNGIAMKDGNPAYVTATGRADVVNGWRARREAGGCVIDVAANEIITEKLSMPHSPRWHDGKLWVLNSGTGHLGTVDPDSGDYTPIVFLPGFVRGLTFHNNHAIIGLSLPREGAFAGLQLDDELKKRDADPWCGVQIVNLGSRDVVQWIRFESAVSELLDVRVLPGVRYPSASAPGTPDIDKLITFDMSSKPDP